MTYRDPEAPLADAYRTAMRQVRGADAEARFMDRRVPELYAALSAIPPTLQVPAGRAWTPYGGADTVPIALDFARWVEESDYPTDLIVAMATGPYARAEVFRRYALAKAEDEAKARNWTEEAQDARAWERGGLC